MAGHSHWAQVKHKKVLSDAKRGALFGKLVRLISVAAHEAGGDPTRNTKLRTVIEQARESGLPRENIERAIARSERGVSGEDMTGREYEAYGPGGVAVLIEAITDNPNRTTNDVKRILGEHGGKLAVAGSVAWLFQRRVVAEVRFTNDRTRGELSVIDAGAEDIETSDGTVRALVRPERFSAFQRAIEERGLKLEKTERAMVAANALSLVSSERAAIEALAAALENHPDVTAVWTNLAG
jgi:YebC/PmpR family DNA-binding regulatory protein